MKQSWKGTSSGVQFHIKEGNEFVAPSAWPDLQQTYYLPGIALMQELMDNAQAEIDGEGVLISYEEIAALSSIEQKYLKLPARYPFDIRIDSKGVIGQPEFLFDLGYYNHPEGKRYRVKRIGSFITFGESTYVLSAEQHALAEKVEAFNALPADKKMLTETFIELVGVQELSERAAAILDSFLQNEEIIVPEKISIIPVDHGDTLELVPVVGEGEGAVVDPEFVEKFDRRSRVGNKYAFQKSDGTRKRIVLKPEVQEELKKVKAHRRVSGEQKDALLANPEAVFDPDLVDLDAYGKRVVAIGFYQPRFYPFISPYKSQWIPGFVVESKPGERVRVQLKTFEVLEKFEQEIKEVKKRGESKVAWEGVDVPVEQADNIARVARRQLEKPEKPVQSEEGEKVLLIAENIDEVDFGEGTNIPVVQHTYTPPPDLKQGIRPRAHQEEAIAWLQVLSSTFTGGLLADDMGLGKTLSVLSFIKWHAAINSSSEKPYLIVAPVSLLENWENEYEKFFMADHPSVLRLYGDIWRNLIGPAGSQEGHLSSDMISKQICLTTYETLRKRQLAFGKINWAAVVLDEAQRVKTPGTLVTNAAKAMQADFKIAMTGTPVENSLVDLWCIMDFVAPGMLGSARDFSAQYQRPLKKPDTDVAALTEQLRSRIGDAMKRRLKKDVLHELPAQHSHKIEQPMPAAQRDRYLLEIDRVQESRSGGMGDGREVLKALHAMRAISDHPYLEEFQLETIPIQDVIASSAKLQIILPLLKNIQASGEKVVLFAERRNTQQMLSRTISHCLGVCPRIINGDTPASKRSKRSAKQSRQQIIDEFEAIDGFNALVMSPVAAGVGLNITAANHVIHYARHWNPAKEDQATDRVYRLGQEKEVHVYYPMAVMPDVKSFDVILDDLLTRKRTLAEASLFPTEQAEVETKDMYDAVFGAGASEKPDEKPLTLIQIDRLAPHLFEAFVATLYKKLGYEVTLTPRQNDRGADVVAMKEGEHLLIQVKQTRRTVGNSGVQEIVAACAYYQIQYGVRFRPSIVTNGTLTSAALNLARANNAVVIERRSLHESIAGAGIKFIDVQRAEHDRLERI